MNYSSSEISRAVIPVVPSSVFSAARITEPLPSVVTFVVAAGDVVDPQMGQPWFVEMDHDMSRIEFYSLIPQDSRNEWVSHYRVEKRRPRFRGEFRFMDAWLETQRRRQGHVYFSETLFNAEKCYDKLYFPHPPKQRIEVIVPGFIEDREIFQLLAPVIPKEYQIEKLLQRQP